jgi:hypothetical protein
MSEERRRRRASIFVRSLRMIIFLFLLFLSLSTIGQRTDWRTNIDAKVQRADSLSLKSQKIFYLNKFLKDNRQVKETWYYTLQEEKIIIFEIKYVADSIEYSEIYYLDNGRLICMEEYEVPYLSVYADDVKSGAALFFDNENLRQFVVTGRNKNNGRWDRSYESLRRFEQRYEELKKTIQYQPRRN